MKINKTIVTTLILLFILFLDVKKIIFLPALFTILIFLQIPYYLIHYLQLLDLQQKELNVIITIMALLIYHK